MTLTEEQMREEVDKMLEDLRTDLAKPDKSSKIEVKLLKEFFKKAIDIIDDHLRRLGKQTKEQT